MRRIHQEDICQATGRSPRAKYELRRGGRGPSFDDVAVLLDKFVTDPNVELDRLVAVATFAASLAMWTLTGKTFLCSIMGAGE